MTVLLSIKSKWWQKIVKGEKNIEIRNIWNKDINHIIFYESHPVKKVVGEADCISYKYALNYSDSINNIYRFSENNVMFKPAINKKELKQYLYKHDFTWFIYIINLNVYEKPKELIDYGYTRPPQNYYIYFDKAVDHRKKTRIRQILDNNQIETKRSEIEIQKK